VLAVPKMGAIVPKNRRAFQRKFEREVGKQSAYFRKEFDKWTWVMNNEYEKVLRHLHLVKNVEKMSQGEMFERLMPWLVIVEVGRNILRAAELRMFLRGVEHGMQIAGFGFAFDVNNPLFVEAARLRAASLVKYVSESARKNLHDMTMQALDAGWSVDALAVKMRGHLTALPVSQRRIMREATERLASGVSQGKVDVWVGREMTRMTNYRAFMVARTEASAAMNDGALMGYKQAGVKMVEWLAQFDACEVCSSFAGELFTVEESFGLIPEHPNCICSWAPVIGTDLL